MNNIFLSTTLLPVLICIGVCANADTLTGSGGLQSWTASALGSAASPTNSGTPYWNNLSADGATANIGWCLTGGGSGCSLSNPPGAVPYYGNSNGTAADGMHFISNGSPLAASLLGVFSNQNGVPNGTDYFGWYALTAGNTLGAMTALFNSTASMGTTAAFSPTSNYGFYFENVQSAGTPIEADYFWFTDSSFDYATGTGTSDGLQHFSTFATGTGFILGMEDTNGAGSDNDFNDLIVQVQNTPEPFTMALIGGGLVVCGFLARRKKN